MSIYFYLHNQSISTLCLNTTGIINLGISCTNTFVICNLFAHSKL